MSERNNGIYGSAPEHGLERHRKVGFPQWTPELKRLHTEATIRLIAARLEEPHNPDAMARIIEDAELIPQLGGMYFTLVGPNGKAYARKAIVWAFNIAQSQGVKLGDEVMEIAKRHLEAYKIRRLVSCQQK